MEKKINIACPLVVLWLKCKAYITHSLKVKVKSLSYVPLFVTPWTVAHKAPPSMEFSRQECWSGLPFPSPGDLPDPGIEPGSPVLQADGLSHQGSSCSVCCNSDVLTAHWTL